MLGQDREREAECAGVKRFAQQRADLPRFILCRLTLHSVVPHDELTERRQGGQKSDVDTNPALSRRSHILRETFPVPREALAEDLVGNGLNMDKVRHRNIVLFGPTRSQSDTAVAHDDAGHAMPG